MRRAFILRDGIQRWIVAHWLGGLMGVGALGSLGSVPLVAQDKALGVSGVEKENFSKTLKPSDDFFRFVNENWLETTDIPPDQSNFGAFTALDIETKGAIRAIIEQASSSSDASAEAKQVGNLFKSYTDVEARNKAGIAPVKPWLDSIRAIRTLEDALGLAGELSIYGIPSFYAAGVDVDDRKSDQYAVYLYQDGTTLPDRDYYLESDPELVSRREKYEVFIKDMLSRIGWENPEAMAKKI
ncbi:MAG: hypothetical protein ACKO9Q_13655, partial [Pirellula sp.]